MEKLIFLEKAVSMITIAIEWLRTEESKHHANLPKTDVNPQSISNQSKLYWTGKIVDFVELIFALFEAKVFNHGNITKKALIKGLCSLFNIKASAVNVHYNNIKSRSNRTKFLSEIQTLLETKMDEDEEKIVNRYKGVRH